MKLFSSPKQYIITIAKKIDYFLQNEMQTPTLFVILHSYSQAVFLRKGSATAMAVAEQQPCFVGLMIFGRFGKSCRVLIHLFNSSSRCQHSPPPHLKFLHTPLHLPSSSPYMHKTYRK